MNIIIVATGEEAVRIAKLYQNEQNENQEYLKEEKNVEQTTDPIAKDTRHEVLKNHDRKDTDCCSNHVADARWIKICNRCMLRMEVTGEPWKGYNDDFLLYLAKIPIEQRCRHKKATIS